MCLSQCVVENELHKENINLPRFVGLPEDSHHVHNCEIKTENENNIDVVATVTPTRESRKNNRRYQNIQAE